MGIGERDSLPNDELSSLEYPGRFIVLGMNPNGLPIAVYGITGRSPSSQARKLVTHFFTDQTDICVEPTDSQTVKEGNIDLLIYPAMRLRRGITVSNGKQTEKVNSWLESKDPLRALVEGHEGWSYEPDAPTFTPRITGCVTHERAALGIIKRLSRGIAQRQYFEVPLEPGRGMFISTYAGENDSPLPAFRGEPLEVSIEDIWPLTIAQSFYNAFAPLSGKPDMRVAVAAVGYLPEGKGYIHEIVNRCDEEKKQWEWSAKQQVAAGDTS